MCNMSRLYQNFQFSTFNFQLSLGVPAVPSGFPLYLFPLRSKRMPLQSLTHNVNKIYHLSNMKSVVHHTLISRHSELSSPYLPICLSIFILNFQFSTFNFKFDSCHLISITSTFGCIVSSKVNMLSGRF